MAKTKKQTVKLDLKATSLAFGAVWAAYLFLLGVFAPLGFGGALITTIASLYQGYAPGLVGGIIGAVYGFIDAAVAGLVIAYLYNYISSR